MKVLNREEMWLNNILQKDEAWMSCAACVLVWISDKMKCVSRVSFVCQKKREKGGVSNNDTGTFVMD